MEDVIEEAVRMVGVVTLKVLTLGRYRADPGSLVAEGGLGLAIIALAMWLAYGLLT